MRKSRQAVLATIAAAIVLASVSTRQGLGQLKDTDETVPTTRVRRGDLDLKVYTTGELRPAKRVMLVAPPVGGGTLRIVHLAKTGTPVKTGDVVMEFDPAEQQYNLEQNRSELDQAEEQIVKAKADAAVQTAQDQVALLKDKYAVRQAELDVQQNELLAPIDAKKNLLKLEEAKRALAQLEQDIKSHTASNQATIAVSEEKRTKAKLAMQQAEQNIENMRVKTPINGLVQVRENQEASGGFFFTGMTLPDYREGDQVYPGSFVAEVLDTEQMELQAKLVEGDRANLKQGEPVEVRVDALPGAVFSAHIKTVASMASSDMWGGDSTRRFDASFALDKPDPRLRPGYTAHLTIVGSDVKNVLVLPRQAIFEKAGKPIVYVKTGNRFEAHDVQVKYRSESRVAVEGLNEGAEVALVDPEQAARKPQKSAGPLTPAAGGVSR
ncbi:MAG TPA: efflux RND transporter periplasmic adaptor subunit [Terriglobia bacterium]|nr:efflux RND transporter periplasmic adaptor subunit [Terriglobia bacterium]